MILNGNVAAFNAVTEVKGFSTGGNMTISYTQTTRICTFRTANYIIPTNKELTCSLNFFLPAKRGVAYITEDMSGSKVTVFHLGSTDPLGVQG